MNLVKRLSILMGGSAVSGAVIFVSFVQFSPKLIFNPTTSAPIGFYSVAPEARPNIGDYILIDLPSSVKELALKRGYVGPGIPLLKQVYALYPDHICGKNGVVYVNGRPVASAKSFDSRGRAMPLWQGCRKLRRGDIFLLNLTSPYSFDSRYFGPVERQTVRGVATPLWVKRELD